MKFTEFINNKRKMINILLMILFCFLIIYMMIASITINKRLIAYTDTIEKYEAGRFGGSGSRSDIIELVDKNYDLYRGYYVFPTVLVAIERKKMKNYEGEKITYFVDPHQIKEAIKFKSPDYVAIAGEINGGNKKGSWYWFSLIAYVAKYAGFFISIVPAIALFGIVIGFKPESNFEITFHLFAIFCIIIWGFVL